jgi:hypothetical protein
MFDEFCKKYCDQENRRFEMMLSRGSASGGFATPSSSVAMTPRSVVQTPRSMGGSAQTPRTLVRTAQGLKMV